LSSSPAAVLSAVPDARALAGTVAHAAARNARIQYLRAFAATSVVLCHASVVDGRFGVYGVSLFFAISGYLMSGLVRSTDPWRFLSHRVLRIYPIFFLLVAFSLILNRLLGTPFSFDLLAMTLAPLEHRSYTLGGIEWTLVFEVAYYTALFLLACANLQRYLELVAAAWIGVIVASAWFLPSLGNGLHFPIHLLFLAPANLAFAGGLLLPFLLSRGYLPRATVLAVIPVALTYDFVDLGTNRLMSSIAAICLVGWAAQWKAPPNHPASKPLLALGDWSYALYLCHVPVVQAVVQLWPTSLQGLNPGWFAVGTALLAVALFGPLDIALYRKLRVLADAARPRTNQIAMSLFAVSFLGLASYGSITNIKDRTQNDRIKNTLEHLGPKARMTPDAASARIAETQLAVPSSFRGAFERVDHVEDGRIILRGWALSGSDASEDIKLRAFCNGRQIGIERHQRKMRRDIADVLGRNDATTKRFGFTLLVSQQACPKGAQVFVVAFDEAGKAAVLPGLHAF
jgi:exopolysaccharide production protein ExoZ